MNEELRNKIEKFTIEQAEEYCIDIERVMLIRECGTQRGCYTIVATDKDNINVFIADKKLENLYLETIIRKDLSYAF